MEVIFKYSFTIQSEFQISFQGKVKRVLHADVKDSTPVLWVIIDEDGEPETLRFAIRGTGERFYMNEGEYINTFYEPSWVISNVWHLFLLKESDK